MCTKTSAFYSPFVFKCPVTLTANGECFPAVPQPNYFLTTDTMWHEMNLSTEFRSPSVFKYTIHFLCVNDQREAQFLYNQFYSTVFWLLYMFRMNLVVLMLCSWWWTTRFVRNMYSRQKLWNKIDYKNCASRWSLKHCNMMHGTHNVLFSICGHYSSLFLSLNLFP